MAYLDNSQHSGSQIPRKSQSSRKSAFTTPTRRRSHIKNTHSPIIQPSSRRSTPSTVGSRHRAPSQASAFPPRSTARTLPTLDPDDSVNQGREVSPSQKPPNASHCSINHHWSPRPFASRSEIKRPSPSLNGQTPSPRTANSFQSAEMHKARISDGTIYAQEEGVERPTEDDDVDGEEEIHAVAKPRQHTRVARHRILSSGNGATA